jgi:diguanylate cyclase (GGDEF)-like protein/PAS domain S-box-containing protein
MGLTTDVISLIRKTKPKSSNYFNKENFEKINTTITLQKIRIFSVIIVAFSMYFFYVDFVVLKDVEDLIFRKNLINIHIISFIISIIYLVLYKYIKKVNPLSLIPKIIIWAYIFIGIFLAALASINSQRLEIGNLNAYVFIIVIMALVYTVEPWSMLGIYIINHMFFIYKISTVDQSISVIISNQINSTAVVVAGISITFLFHAYRVKDFINKNKLEASESTFKKLFYINPLPLYVIRFTDGVFLFANEKALNFYTISKGVIASVKIRDIYANKEEWTHISEEIKKTGYAHNRIVEQLSLAGEKRWVITNYEVIDYNDEKAILCGVTDISEIKKMENQLIEHASTDPLTGVINRRKGLEILEDVVVLAKEGKLSFILCFVDINGLKIVNDKYGHNEGDFLITTICNVIKDKISSEDILFRHGGDEFIILFKGKSIYEVKIICDKIKDKLQDLNNKGIKPYPIGISFGLYEYDKNKSITVKQIIEIADKEMYKSKTKSI